MDKYECVNGVVKIKLDVDMVKEAWQRMFGIYINCDKLMFYTAIQQMVRRDQKLMAVKIVHSLNTRVNPGLGDAHDAVMWLANVVEIKFDINKI